MIGETLFFLGGIEGCRFRKPVVPGDTLVWGRMCGKKCGQGYELVGRALFYLMAVRAAFARHSCEGTTLAATAGADA